MWRAAFLPFYLTYLLAGLSINLYFFFQTPEHAGWLASTLCHLIGVIWFLYLRSTRLTNVNLITVVITASSGAAMLIAAGYYIIVDDAAGLGLFTAVSAFVLWFIYQLTCLRMKSYKGSLKVGDRFPELQTTASAPLAHLPVKGEQQWIVFQEGDWSAFARFQSDLLNASAEEFKQAGCMLIRAGFQAPRDAGASFDQVVLSSAEARDANKLLLSNSLPFGLSNEASHRHTARPSAFLVDSNGTIEAVVMPNDRRKLPSADFMLRYLTKKGA